jgi:hypothetical protein
MAKKAVTIKRSNNRAAKNTPAKPARTQVSGFRERLNTDAIKPIPRTNVSDEGFVYRPIPENEKRLAPPSTPSNATWTPITETPTKTPAITTPNPYKKPCITAVKPARMTRREYERDNDGVGDQITDRSIQNRKARNRKRVAVEPILPALADPEPK